MEKIHKDVHVFVLLCKFQTWKHKSIHAPMYIFHLAPTSPPPSHYMYVHHNGKGPLSSIHVFASPVPCRSMAI